MGKLLDMFQNAGLVVLDLRDVLPTNPDNPWILRDLTDIKGAVIHHTAGWPTATAEALAHYHIEKRDMPGLAYTFYLGYSLSLMEQPQWVFCHKLREIGWHARGVNSHTFGIALGGYYVNEKPPMWMVKSMAKLIEVLRQFFREETGERLWVNPHYAVGRTACPGRVWEAYNKYRIKESGDKI